MATKAYSPITADQMSQDQIIRETGEFMVRLFEAFLNTEMNLRECLEFEDVVKCLVLRNFDVDPDSESLMTMGLSIFLFIKLSKLYSENMNSYHMMEKLVAILMEKIPTLYFEFVLFLLVMEKRETEDSSPELKALRGIFQGLNFERMCDILNRCSSYLEGVTLA